MRIMQEQMQKFFMKLKASFADYKITLTGIVLLTIYEAVSSMLPYGYEPLFFLDEDEVFCILTLFCSAALFVETCFREKRTVRIFGFLCAALAAGIFTFLMELDETMQIIWLSGAVLSQAAVRLMAGYVFLLLSATVYCSFKRAETGFEKYALNVFSNLFKTFIVYFILTTGVTIIIEIFNILFLEDSTIYLDIACVILVTGLYLAPNCIMALNDMKSDPGPFTRMIVRYVLTVLTICATVIVYLYVLKLLILREIPSNEIFSILSALFCFGMPVWVMAAYYQDGTHYSRLITAMPYIFAPLICLQVYSMGVRILQYGMTTNRYMGMMLIIFEIGTLLIWHFLKGQREKILLFLCLLIVISVYVPRMNMYHVSNSWQFSFLKKYYRMADAGEKLSALECERLAGAWEYLKREAGMQDAVKDYDMYSDEFAKKLEKVQEEEIDITQYDTHSIHCCQMVGGLDVSDYQNMFMLNQDDSYNKAGEEGVEVDFSKFRFVIRGTEEIITVDIQDFTQRCMDYEKKHPDAGNEEITNVMKAYNQIPLEDGRVLFINHFQITYQDGIKSGKKYFYWQTVNLGGILLEK